MTTKAIKYYYCCSSSLTCGNVLPPKPDGARSWFPLSRAVALCLKNRLCKGSRKALTFSMNLNHLRKSSVTVPESFIVDAQKKYIKSLTRPSEDKTLNCIPYVKVIQSFSKVSHQQLIDASVNFLSTSACAEKSIHGQAGYIDSIAPKISIKMVLDQSYHGVCPLPFFAYALVPEVISGKASFLPEPLKVRCITTENAMEFAAGKPYQDALADKMKRHPNLLFGRMVQESDILSLVMRSVDYWETRGFRKEDLEFVSGDYEAATDNINPKTSQLIDQFCFKLGLLPDFTLKKGLDYMGIWSAMAKVFEYLPIYGPNSTKSNWRGVSEWFRCAISTSSGDDIKVSDIRSRLWDNRQVQTSIGKKKLTVTQTFGQMMGDIKSFPVLCILNLALWSEVCDNETVVVERIDILKNRSYHTMDAPVLVNGDDVLGFAPRCFIDKWKEKAKEFDFILSIGKSYESKKLAVINSRPYYLKWQGNRPIVTAIELKQMNLIMNQAPDLPFSGNLDLVTDLKSPKDQGEMFGLFMKFNKQRVTDETRDGLVGLFVSRDLGGLGCTLRPGIRNHVTRKQSIVAKDCYERLQMGKKVNFSALPKWKIASQTGNGLIIHSSSSKDPTLGLIASYSTTSKTRKLARDDWVATMSKVKFTGRGYFVNSCRTQAFRNIVRRRKHRYNDLDVPFDIYDYIHQEKTVVEKYVHGLLLPKLPNYSAHVVSNMADDRILFNYKYPVGVPCGGCINL